MDTGNTRKWWALALLATAQFVVVLDASVVNVALPSIGADLDLGQEGLAWLVNAYVQALGAAILSPAALSLVTTTFAEGAERNTALGVWGAVAAGGGAAGSLLGGVITQTLGW